MQCAINSIILSEEYELYYNIHWNTAEYNASQPGYRYPVLNKQTDQSKENQS
jgi:hypothetical protein